MRRLPLSRPPRSHLRAAHDLPSKTHSVRRSAPPRRTKSRISQANLAASAFKERALPIHINITHTPPALVEPEGEGKGEAAVSVASADPGFIGTATLLPGTFSTGSYGWKGYKRFAVEIDGPDGGKEKVHVMLTYVPFPTCCYFALLLHACGEWSESRGGAAWVVAGC